jgi:hemolysin III
LNERFRVSTDATTMQSTKRSRPYKVGEEIANSVTHGIGAILSIVALTMMVVFAVQGQDGWALASVIIYGMALVFEYVMSTLYHSFPWPKTKHVFKILDHAGIYLLIAGTYTPFMLITLRDDGGWWLFVLIWGLAIAGIAVEAAWTYRPRWISAAVYVGIGWLAVFMIEPLLANLDTAGVVLLVAGGVAYTGGVAFYVLKKVPYMHMVWHLWVLLGSVLHFLAIILYVI